MKCSREGIPGAKRRNLREGVLVILYVWSWAFSNRQVIGMGRAFLEENLVQVFQGGCRVQPHLVLLVTLSLWRENTKGGLFFQIVWDPSPYELN